jgi:anti-sigma regulatory factor (Ser/Thr protein kinase)
MPAVGDVIILSIPSDKRFFGVARLFVGGLASRLDFTYEQLDDLQLAVESVLHAAARSPGVTLEAEIQDESAVEIRVGPLDMSRLEAAAATEGVTSLDRLLARLVAGVHEIDRDDGHWLALQASLPVGDSRSA